MRDDNFWPARYRRSTEISEGLKLKEGGKMHRVRGLLGILLAGALLGGAIQGTAADLTFTQTTFDAGPTFTGAPLKHTFTFVNSGPDIIKVTGLHTTCGCLTPKMDKLLYLPDEKGEITLEVNTLTQPEGAQHWPMTIQTERGGQTSTQVLTIKATLRTEIAVTPATLTLYTQGTLTHQVTVTDLRPGGKLQVQQARTTSPHVQARLAGNRPDSAGHLQQGVEVSLAPGCPDGRVETTLSIYTSDPIYPELRVPVTIVKRGAQGVTSSPSSVSLVTGAGQPAPGRVVLLRGNEETPVVVDSLHSDHPAVLCRWAAGPGKMATVKLLIDPAQIPGGELRTAVRIQVSKPRAQTVIIPVQVTIR